MEEYFCKCCKYHTGHEWNFKAHFDSKKHKLLSSNDSDENVNDIKCINVEDFKHVLHICPTCDNIYMSKRALQKHEAVHHTENDIKPTKKISVKMNKVVEQVKLVKKQSIPHILRIKVWNKWIGEEIGKTKCLCCKLNDICQLNFVCGHIIAESKGGDIDVDNLKPICQPCNNSMGTQNMNEFILKYKF